jgi:hypothetical protein
MMHPFVEIEFECLPLRSIVRIDIPLDASPAYRARCERLQKAIEKHGSANAYFLYNTHCVYRLANSDIENMLRFTFEGIVLTDRSDGRAERGELDVKLTSETCGSLPPEVQAWFRSIVERTVLIEFNHFISAGHLAARVQDLGQGVSIDDITNFAGMNV